MLHLTVACNTLLWCEHLAVTCNIVLWYVTPYSGLQQFIMARNTLLWLATPYCDVWHLAVTCNILLWYVTPYSGLQQFIMARNTLLWLATPYCDVNTLLWHRIMMHSISCTVYFRVLNLMLPERVTCVIPKVNLKLRTSIHYLISTVWVPRVLLPFTYTWVTYLKAFVLTRNSMITVFLSVRSRSLVHSYQHFGWVCYLRLQGRSGVICHKIKSPVSISCAHSKFETR
jgi:hypothetical protein